MQTETSKVSFQTAPKLVNNSLTLRNLFPPTANVRPFIKPSLLLTAAIVLVLNAKKILWPRAQPDPAFRQETPEASFGCPFFGHQFYKGDVDFGTGAFFLKQAKKLKNKGKSLWSYYFLLNPVAIPTGLKQTQQVLSAEFDSIETIARGSILLGEHALTAEKDKARHQSLRRLIGQSMTPSAISESLPFLQKGAEIQLDRMLEMKGPIQMEQICTDFTLDVAWRQILGLDLKSDEEIKEFQDNVNAWVSGLGKLRSIIGIGAKQTKAYKARMHLMEVVEDKIAELRKNGDDSSTLSKMVFATDDEAGGVNKMSDEEIIDNSLVLILAGSETAATTLMNAMLALGLQKDKWAKLVEEQASIRDKYGDELTHSILEKECPYLDGVIKESLRLRTVPGGVPRRTVKTMVVDNKQIPKGWLINWCPVLTHYYDPKTYKEDGSHYDIRTGFEPERWMSEETAPTEFIPFGASHRYCLGANLAMAEMRVFLASLARKIDFDLATITPESKIEWRPLGVIPKEKDGVMVNARKSELVLN
jgi:cytochrome P450